MGHLRYWPFVTTKWPMGEMAITATKHPAALLDCAKKIKLRANGYLPNGHFVNSKNRELTEWPLAAGQKLKQMCFQNCHLAPKRPFERETNAH
jgi:hypothetical protein